MEDEEYFHEIKEDRGLKPKTLQLYKLSLTHYTNYNQLSLNELLLEAEKEEEERIRMRHRTIRKRLRNFQTYLKEEYEPSTINTMMHHVKSFYSHYEIELPSKIKTLTVPIHETKDDIPTMEHVRTAVNGTGNLKHKAIFLFMASSGVSSRELINLTIQDFINATKDYHNSTDINDVLNELQKQDDVIPTWTFIREKVNYEYYCFNSPEATNAIIKYLSSRGPLKPYYQLFKYSQQGLSKLFQRTNERHNWPEKKTRIFFHPHAMRKLFATTLVGAKIEGRRLEETFIEWMLGHRIAGSKAAYYKSKPHILKEDYFLFVHELCIREIEFKDKTPAQIKQIVRENQERAKENKELREELNQEKKKREEFERHVLDRLKNI